MFNKYLKNIREDLSPVYLPVDYEYDMRILWSIGSKNNKKLLKYWMEKLNIDPKEANKRATITIGVNKYALKIKKDFPCDINPPVIFRWYIRQIVFKKYNEIYIIKRDNYRHQVCYNLKATKFLKEFSKHILEMMRVFLATKKVSYMDIYTTSLLVFARDVLGEDDIIDRYKEYIDKVVYLP